VFVGYRHAALPVGCRSRSARTAAGCSRRRVASDRDNLLAVAGERSASGSGFRIGYEARDWARGQDPRSGKSVRYLRDLWLIEYSFTASPANPAAVVTGVKSKLEMFPIDIYREWGEKLARWLAEAKAQQAERDR